MKGGLFLSSPETGWAFNILNTDGVVETLEVDPYNDRLVVGGANGILRIGTLRAPGDGDHLFRLMTTTC